MSNISKSGSKDVIDDVLKGAMCGTVAWTVYALVESWFLVILPWIIKPSYEYLPSHWGFTALLFVIYPAAGAVLGGLSALCLSIPAIKSRSHAARDTGELYSYVATFTAVLAFSVNLFYNLPLKIPSVSLTLVAALLLMLALIVSVRSVQWADRLRFLTNPWTGSIVLVGLMWGIKDLLSSYSRVIKAGSALSYLVIVLLFSYVVQLSFKRRRTGGRTYTMHTFSAGYLILLICGVVFVTGANFFLKQTPRLAPVDTGPSAVGAYHSNVIMITMDTVRADHLSPYGYERDTTPNLKTFSEDATLYTRAFAPGDMTLSSHASIFTGMYARKHGAYLDPWNGFGGGRPLNAEFRTLAEVLTERGYMTTGIVSNHAYLTHDFSMDQGFQYYDQRMPVILLGKVKPYFIRFVVRNILTSFFSPSDSDQLFRRAGEINREVFKQLDTLKDSERPFFLFINYMDAHDPYIPPSPFDVLYPGKDEAFTLAHYHDLMEKVMKRERKISDKEHGHLVSQYDGGIAYMDFHIGKLLARLKELGLFKNSLIIITSDHGEVFGERDLIGHGVSVYQDQIYIPLLIKYPNESNGMVVDENVSLVDLVPTVLDVLDYENPEGVQGVSLLSPGPRASRILISESFPDGDMLEWHPKFDRVERAVISGQHKLISSSAGKRELYNISEDPDENNNLLNVDNELATRLDAGLNQWLKTVKTESPLPAKLKKDTLDRLKALGYIK